MQNRRLRRVANRASHPFMPANRGYGSFDRDFEMLVSAMTRDFERNLRSRYSSPWDFFEHSPSLAYEPPAYYRQPVHSTYEQKTITSDETGRVVVKTQRKMPGQPWETYVEEYVNDKQLEQSKKPEAINQSSEPNNARVANSETADHHHQQQQQQQQTTRQSAPELSRTTEAAAPTSNPQNGRDQTISTQPNHPAADSRLNPFDQHFHQLSNRIMRDFGDFDDFFDMGLPVFDTSRLRLFEPPEVDMQDIDNNATYHAKTIINDNGNVSVKTVSKKPGSAWETTVKHYGKNGALEESQQKTEMLDNNSKSEQKVADKSEQRVASRSEQKIADKSEQKVASRSEQPVEREQKIATDETVSH